MNTWQDCFRFLPYRDYLGHWRLPDHTQRRRNKNGVWEYQEREETIEEEWNNRNQW